MSHLRWKDGHVKHGHRCMPSLRGLLQENTQRHSSTEVQTGKGQLPAHRWDSISHYVYCVVAVFLFIIHSMYLSDATASCRKCRFDRFTGIMRSARLPLEVSEAHSTYAEQIELPVEVPELEDIKDVKLIEIPSTSFIDHTKLYELESASDAPLLDRIRRAYSMFCMMRKIGETSMQPSKGNFCKERLFERDYLKFIPATSSNSVIYGHVYAESMLDFAHTAFDDFRILSAEEKKTFFRHSLCFVGNITLGYRSLHHFPYDETVFISYTTTLNYGTASAFFDDAPSEINRDTATRTLRDGIRKTNMLLKESFRRVMPTEDEYMALIGLAFWNIELDASDSNLTRLAVKNQAQIMREMHQYYCREGRTDYAARIGELFCLLVTMQKSVSVLAEEVQLYRLMDVFDESKFEKKCGYREIHDK
ncbi:hypothetical protein PENTCL1PPCAC_14365 [Pristionchus entomophagus]|uniref:NR LBD domain-containing protein n=1 Tax=Pristionchus entomophagus TaxID=358040 RepID=A0AAV5TFV8_9BILA|nr:hypothetical protein PENTCL1PPCAC_14365 [Pristionchus entomophagus]